MFVHLASVNIRLGIPRFRLIAEAILINNKPIWLAGDCRQKLESSQKKLEPVPLIGFLTGLLIKFHIIHKIADSRVYLHLLILFLVLSWTLQRKLWSFWRELSHGTLTYRDREVDHYLWFFASEGYRHCWNTF